MQIIYDDDYTYNYVLKFMFWLDVEFCLRFLFSLDKIFIFFSICFSQSMLALN